MNTVKAYVYTGRTDINKDISNYLLPQVTGFAIDFITDPIEADVVITLPEYIQLFIGYPILALTDSRDSFEEYESVVEYTPFPISTDDFTRLEFRLIGVAADIRMSA